MNKFENNDFIIYFFTIPSIMIVFIYLRYIKPYFYPIRGRSMSFNSSSMMGTFPESCKVPPPIINGVLLFRKCPSLESIKKSTNNLFDLERFRRVPIYNKSNDTWSFEETNEREGLYSSLTVSNEAELLEEISRY